MSTFQVGAAPLHDVRRGLSGSLIGVQLLYPKPAAADLKGFIVRGCVPLALIEMLRTITDVTHLQ